MLHLLTHAFAPLTISPFRPGADVNRRLILSAHDPPMSEALHARFATGLRHLEAGRPEQALAAFRRVLAGDPSHTGAWRNLIRALAATGDHAAVLTETTRALRLAPESAELRFLRGTALNALGRAAEARVVLEQALSLNPNSAAAWLNLGNAHAELDDLTRAEAHCRQARVLDPRLIEAHISLGYLLTRQGRTAEAILVLEAALRCAPDNAQGHWNLAVAALLSGDLPRGFAEYEWRKRHDRFRHDFISLPGPVWGGPGWPGPGRGDGDPFKRSSGDLSNPTILIHAEQGLGDTIQFARYAPLIAERGGKPVLACEPGLIPLLRTLPNTRIVSKFAPLPAYDAWIDQMSLPGVFGTTLETIPAPDGYLTPDPARMAAHRASLPLGRCIGLAWSGNPLHSDDRRRTPPPGAFAPLLAVPGLTVVGLVPGRTLPGVLTPPRALTDYAETAALIAALDLVIAVDTSVAHVAGALGRPVWVLLPHAPDWRWLLSRNDTPWYRSARLFRQPSPGDWGTVMDAVTAALAV